MNIVKKLIKYLLLILILISAALVILWLLNEPKPFVKGNQSALKLEQALHSVSYIDLEFVDSTRNTPKMGGFKGDDKRVLKGGIWFPEGDVSSLPLIVYSHGFGGYFKDSTYLAEYLASNGYVVAAIDFPLSNRSSPAEVPQLLDIANQPGDVKAVIDQVLSFHEDSKSPLYQRIDAKNIGAMGLSLGGLTTALVSFHPDLKDERIKAVIMMAPPLEAFSTQFFSSNTQVKSLLMSGSMDRVVPESRNATQVQERHPQGWFLSLDKGTHLGFADLANPIRWMENPDNLGCMIMGFMLSKLDLPERWNAVIPNTNGVLLDVEAGKPCPDSEGESMNGLRQQWLTQISVAAFFDMQLLSGDRAKASKEFFTTKLVLENPEISLRAPL